MSTVNFNPYQATYDASSAEQSNPMSQVTNAVAQLLGVSTHSLSASLSSGQTFAQIAGAQGVSTDSLVSTIAKTLAANAPAGAPTLSSDQLTTMATDIANGTRHHPGTTTASTGSMRVQGANTASTVDDLASLLGLSNQSVAAGLANGATLTDLLSESGSQSAANGGGNGPMSQVNSAVANLLGVSTESLSTRLSSGETLAQIATSQGVSTDSLVSTIATAMATNPPEGAPALSSDQLKTIATDIANGTPPSPAGLSSGSATATTSTAVQQLTDTATLDELAKVLGLSSSALSNGLANNTSLSTLLTQSTGLQLDSYL